MQRLLSTILLTTLALSASAQVRKQPPNPKSPATSTSIAAATIEYSAPSARGRQVEGGLIPYNKVWRTGADSATTLIAKNTLTIGDVQVPAGTYTLYTAAAADGNWKLIINKQTGQWGTEYNEGQDLGRTALKVTKLSSPVETFKINLKETGPNSAILTMDWGTSEASVPVKF